MGLSTLSVARELLPTLRPSLFLSFFYFGGLWEERVNLAYVSTLYSITEGSRGNILETGPDAEAMEGYCLLVCSLWHAQPVSV